MTSSITRLSFMAASAKSDAVRSGAPKSDLDDCSALASCEPLGSPDCLCRAAVLRAFQGMTGSGAPYDSALSAALRVFRHHHPEFQAGVRELIEQWISPESIH